MGDIQTRPFSKNYSGLINQSVIALGITVLCVTGHEVMKRRRRGKGLFATVSDFGSRESWQFGYLYHGRSWARFPSPLSPSGWPLSWVKQAIDFPEDKLNELRGLDATLYIRFLRGTFWFTLAHTLTTFPILFPIHVKFSDPSISPKSMTRASIASLVGTIQGLSLLWIHVCLLFWITLSWIFNLIWICNGAFKLRAANLEALSRQSEAENNKSEDPPTYHRHPHPQYAFTDVPRWDGDGPIKGLRLRTVMISNIPTALRSEKALQEYFEHYMSRKVEKPSMGLTSSTPPGFLNTSFAFIFNRAKRLPAHLPANPLIPKLERDGDWEDGKERKGSRRKSSLGKSQRLVVPKIDRVVIARKMTELASLLQRREEILVQLETAHIKLANKTLLAVKAAIEQKEANKPIAYTTKSLEVARKRKSLAVDPELADTQELDEQAQMDLLIDVFRPFVEQFGTQRSLALRSRKVISRTFRQVFRKMRMLSSIDSAPSGSPARSVIVPLSSADHHETTVWDALLSLPRSSLDAYQPLVNLSHLFRGKTVPSIDYYTAKLNLLTSLITENRAKAADDYDAVSTAFVTFADPADARRACEYLAVHQDDPFACLVTMAPMYQDIDWIRIMKSTYKGEFVKDWVVNLGVWAFTLFWLFPVSLLVGLVSIQNISLFWPSLKRYLDRHEWQSEVLQSFIPTLLVALLAFLIPLVLLLIAKKAQTITTLSALHDRIMTRYYKFLIVNVLVFFCVGTAALQSFLESFHSSTRPDLIQIVADSFPTAGPFYVGWLIFTTAIHGGFELVLLGLPLIMYPTTSHQVTPRKRAVGIRPRTYNFYYWLPNHTLVIHVLLLFSLFNPFILPFGTIYFFIESGVVKNQLIHVYAKNYEGDGRLLLIRMVRYTLDGLTLSQAVFLGYMVVLKKKANVGLAAFLIVFTVVVKLVMTRMCRAQFELDDIAEADIICRRGFRPSSNEPETGLEGLVKESNIHDAKGTFNRLNCKPSVLNRLPAWINFSYSMPRRGPQPRHHHPNPFGRQQEKESTLSVEQHCVSERVSPQAGPSGVTKDAPDEGYPWNVPETKRELHVLNISLDKSDSDNIAPHPPPAPWDDQAVIDLPYDNPFYTRTIDNVLWLPRNPTSVLDLDDTVDMKVSITVEAAAGRLGTWLGLGETASPTTLSPIITHTPSALEQTASSPVIPHTLGLPEVDGTENIDLPPIIAQRVQAKEGGVEQTLRTRKSTIYSRRPSTADQNSSSLVSIRIQHPKSVDRPVLPSYRSFSDTTNNRPRSSSVLSALRMPSSDTMDRVSDQGPVTRPDAHAQAEFVAANTSRISLGPPKLSRTPNVSAAHAIFHEVLQEERQALWDRLEEETAEATQSKSTKSWLTSWMFRKPG